MAAVFLVGCVAVSQCHAGPIEQAIRFFKEKKPIRTVIHDGIGKIVPKPQPTPADEEPQFNGPPPCCGPVTRLPAVDGPHDRMPPTPTPGPHDGRGPGHGGHGGGFGHYGHGWGHPWYRPQPYYSPRPWWLPPINIVLGPDGNVEATGIAVASLQETTGPLMRIIHRKPVRRILRRLVR